MYSSIMKTATNLSIGDKLLTRVGMSTGESLYNNWSGKDAMETATEQGELAKAQAEEKKAELQLQAQAAQYAKESAQEKDLVAEQVRQKETDVANTDKDVDVETNGYGLKNKKAAYEASATRKSRGISI